MIKKGVLEKIETLLNNDNDFAFLKRVWQSNPDVYVKRLKQIEFSGFSKILDAGSGMGQWTYALSSMNKEVYSVEFDNLRLEATKEIFKSFNLSNCYLQKASVEELPFEDDSFDAIFSYSVIFLTDYRKTLSEFYRTLKPGGKLYFNTNGLGWYLYNLIHSHNDTIDFSSKEMAKVAIETSIHYYATGEFKRAKYAAVITPNDLVLAFLKQLGFKNIKNENDIENVDYFPVVLKPSIGGGGSANVLIAQSINELKMFTKFLLNEFEEFILQEYVGTPNDEYTVGILTDMQGSYINSIAMNRYILSSLSNRIKVKNRTGNNTLGPILAISSGVSQGLISKFPEVSEPCKRIALKLGATGSINLQCRLFKNKIYVFEINPRFSGTTSSRALVGYNEPDILIRKHLLDEFIEPDFSFKSGLVLRGLEETFFPK